MTTVVERLPRSRSKSFNAAREILEFWPQYKGIGVRNRILIFQQTVRKNDITGTSWGFWVQIQKFREGWTFRAGQGETEWWGRRLREVPPEFQAEIQVALSDFTVKVHDVVGAMKIIDVPIR